MDEFSRQELLREGGPAVVVNHDNATTFWIGILGGAGSAGPAWGTARLSKQQGVKNQKLSVRGMISA